ncbi:hypothetical protein [Crocosphaera sp.]|nr:hypothetical protein [Crocosphaera sp.]MDJ0579416.1 hypothetical protein [Crocosphaera sp.]
MNTDFSQGLEVIGLIILACAIISPILLWLLNYKSETIQHTDG